MSWFVFYLGLSLPRVRMGIYPAICEGGVSGGLPIGKYPADEAAEVASPPAAAGGPSMAASNGT